MRSRNGIVLLEVVVALAIVGLAASAMFEAAGQSMSSLRAAARADARIASAGRLLDAVSLWSRADLDRRLGSRREGAFVLTIQRRQPKLYDVVLSEGSDTLLRTAFFRNVP